jgi:hypothetical protein
MMDEDKTIKRITLENYRQTMDPYMLQEKLKTPYIVLVPINGASPDVLLSMSELYPKLCYIKDLIKLRRDSDFSGLSSFKRLSALPPQLAAFQPLSL